MMVWFFLGAISTALCSLFSTFAFLLLIFVYHFQDADAIFAALLMAGFGILGLWPTQTFATILSSREPMLSITHQGIRIGKLFGSSDIDLPWEEIAAISINASGGLAIHPKNVASFLSRNPLF